MSYGNAIGEIHVGGVGDWQARKSPGSSIDEGSYRLCFVDPEGPYVRAEDLHSTGRMNGLGNYVRTRDAFITIPRISLKDWKNEKR